MASRNSLYTIAVSGPGGSAQHARVQYQVRKLDDSPKCEWRVYRICRDSDQAQREVESLNDEGHQARVVIYRLPVAA